MFMPCGKHCGLFLLLFVITCCFSLNTSFAQDIPASAEPGRLPQNFEETRPPLSTPEPIIPQGVPSTQAPEGAESVKFTLENIVFEGVTAYDPTTFLPYYDEQRGEQVSLNFLYDVANVITTRYRNDGYILSRAVVPQQRIKGGTATIRIIEGYIDNIVIEGDSKQARELMGTYGQKIVGETPLHIGTLERYLLLMRDLPGHYVESLLKPAKNKAGAAELILSVEYQPFKAAFGIDNHGTEFLGPVQSTVRLQGNALLGMGDQTVLRYIGTGTSVPWNRQELRNLDIRHRQIVGHEGTSIGITGISSLSFPGNSLKALETKTRNKIISLDVRHPFIRSRQMNLFGGAQFTYQDAETQLLGLVTANDHIRSLRVNGRFDFVDGWQGITQIFGEVSQGLNLLNNSSSNSSVISRTGGRSDYTKINLEISRLQHVHGPVNLLASVAGQYSPHRLLAAEEFGVGGSNYGRGYDPSEITGDKGIAAKAELQYSGTTDLPVLDSYQLYGFYDFGTVWQTENVAGGHVSLASTGLGTRANVTDWLTGTIELTKPLTRSVSTADPGEGSDSRIFFSLTARY